MENKQNKVVKNAAWLIAERIYTILLSLIVNIISARFLGPSNYGYIAYGASYVALFTSISRLGTDEILVKNLVNSNKQGEIIGTTVILRVVSGILSLIFVGIITSVLEVGNTVLLIVTLLQAITLIANTYEVFNSWFQVELKSRIYAIATIIASTIVAVLRIVLLAINANIYLFAITSSLQTVIILLFIAYKFKTFFDDKLSFSIQRLKSLLTQGAPFIIASIAVTLYTHIDRIMIGYFFSEVEVGFYSIASTISQMWEFIPIAIIQSMRPEIFSCKQKGELNESESKITNLIGIIIGLGVMVALGMMVFGHWIIMLYGSKYLPAETALKILIWATIISTIGSARNIWFISENKSYFIKWFSIAGALMNIVLNYILISIMGINGAAVSTLICELAVVVIFPLMFKNSRRFGLLVIDSVRKTPTLMNNLGKNILYRRNRL